jgi:hypothetical protein
MKKPQFDLNMSVSSRLNKLRLHRWINRHLRCRVRPRYKSGERRYDMAYAANSRRMDQQRLFRFNAVRNPMLRGHRARAAFTRVRHR